ncbi:MAG: protein kinase [Bacteroidota bacterium]|jgi:serine/threonine protein kinase
MIGQTISHYKILEKIGEGGMGIVYKAHDTKLDRDVALKFLPHYLTSDPIEKERFNHEARAAAALTHQNIAVVYEIGEHGGPAYAGAPAGRQIFISMEYVEGQTLKVIVAKESLSIKKVLDLAIQVCEGLAAAHEKGIVHRDIKSDNIIVTPKGQAKITDFGLAKLKGGTKLTKTGSTLGTAAYMSPEQAQGLEVDQRSDIFSFGVVLYELLTSRLPFRGEHEAALMYSLINEEPQPVARFNEKATPEIEHIISKALAKDRDERYQHVDELLSDLRRERRKLEYAKTGHVTAAAAPKPIQKRLSSWIVAGVVLIGIAVGVYLAQFRKPETTSQMVSRTLKVPSSIAYEPNISPDGNWVVYVAKDAKYIDNLYIINASGGEPKKITNDTVNTGKSTPCFSPDGSEIIYTRVDFYTNGDTTNIYKIPVLGGPPRKIITRGRLPIWSPDGKHIGFFRKMALVIASVDGTDEKVITTFDKLDVYNLAWSPDSKEIAFLRTFESTAKDEYTEIFIRDLAAGTERQLTDDKKVIDDFCWTSTDEIVYNSDRGGNTNLWTIPATGGTPKQLTLGADADRVPRVSKDAKRLVFLNESQTQNLWVGDLETKQICQLTFEDAALHEPSFSPDGERIAYKRGTSLIRHQVFICNKNGSDPIQLTDLKAPYSPSMLLRWSGDGKSISYTVERDDTLQRTPWNTAQFFLHDLSTNIPRKIHDGIIADWSSDGKYVLYESAFENSAKYILAAAESVEAPLKQIASRNFATFSRDSKNVIYDDSTGIWSMPIETGVPRLLFRIQKDERIYLPRETGDGKSLAFMERDAKKKVYKLLLLQKSAKQPEELFELPGDASPFISVSPDLKTIIFSRHQSANKIMLIDNFR